MHNGGKSVDKLSRARHVGEVAAKLIGHPGCSCCGRQLKVAAMTVADRKRLRIGGARVYKCDGCGSRVVMTRAEGSAPYVRAVEVKSKSKSKRRVDERQIEMFGDGNGSGK